MRANFLVVKGKGGAHGTVKVETREWLGTTRRAKEMTLRLTTIATALILAFALALMVNVYTAKPAQAHFICCHSVDGNGNIHWRDYQQYDGARSWAVGEWNGVGRISILSDNINASRGEADSLRSQKSYWAT